MNYKKGIKTAFKRSIKGTNGIISTGSKYGDRDGLNDTTVNALVQTKVIVDGSKKSVAIGKLLLDFFKWSMRISSNSGLFGIIIAVILLIVIIIESTGAPIIITQNMLSPKAAITIIKELIGLKQSLLDKIKDSVHGANEVRFVTPNSNGKLSIDAKKILAYMAVKNKQKLDGSEEQLAQLKDLFDKMYKYKVIIYNDVSLTGEHLDNYKIAEIDITVKDIDKIIEEEEWTKKQKDLYNMISSTIDLKKLYPDLDMEELEIKNVLYQSGDLQKIINSAKEIGTRQDLINVARSLIGRVKYFWGGKSAAGYNPMWGSMQMVQAPGDSTTGTYQPYGLDCSGFVDWVYKTSGAGNILTGGTDQQWTNTVQISENELLPGDLGFMAPYGAVSNHIGIFSSRNTNGVKTFIHCTGGKGVVENQTQAFRYWRRAIVNFKGE